MNEKRLNSPIDHYIQGDILQQLYKANGTISFTDLKPDGMENSLFMYHMNKLLARKVVEKAKEGGFSLTKSGVRWVNFVDESSLQPALTPRVLINFLMIEDRKVLVARRTGAAANHLNEYLLPGGLLQYGCDVEESTAILSNKRFGQSLTSELLGIQEVIHHFDDGFSHHTLIILQQASMPKNLTLVDDERYEYVWVELGDIERFNDSPFIKAILERFESSSIKPFESLSFKV